VVDAELVKLVTLDDTEEDVEVIESVEAFELEMELELELELKLEVAFCVLGVVELEKFDAGADRI